MSRPKKLASVATTREFADDPLEGIEQIDFPIFPKTHSPMYLMHQFWGRKPHNVVAEYVSRYSKSGDIVLDCFMGSGVTIAEALKSGRKAVGVDLSPASFLISKMTSKPVDLTAFKSCFEGIRQRLTDLRWDLYGTTCPKCKTRAITSHTLIDYANIKNATPRELRYYCPNCRETGKKALDEDDRAQLERTEKMSTPFWYPEDRLYYPDGQPFLKKEKLDFIYQLFTKRNLVMLSAIWNEIGQIEDRDVRDLLKFTFTSALPQASRLVWAYEIKERVGDVGGWTLPAFWVPGDQFEVNAWNCFEERFGKVLKGKEESNSSIKHYREAREFDDLHHDANVLWLNQSALDMSNIPSNSIDYIFTDPPYGLLQYGELAAIWTSWLQSPIDYPREVIINKYQGKDLDYYHKMIRAAFQELFRVLKPSKYFTLTFHSPNIQIWNSIVKAAVLAGFTLEKVIYQPPARISAKMLLQPYGSAVGDFYLRFRKPMSTQHLLGRGEVEREVYERVVVETTKKILAERGEPTPYSIILNGVYPELLKNGVLLDADKELAQVMREHIEKEFILVEERDEQGKVVGERWWFKNLSDIPLLSIVPLNERVEKAVLNTLNRKVEATLDDILQEVYIRFPNSLTPETQNVKDILAEYAHKSKGGKWILKPIVRQRENDHDVMVEALAKIGEKAGFDVYADIPQFRQRGLILPGIPPENLDRVREIDVVWHDRKEVKYEFEVESTTGITEAIIRGSNIPDGHVERVIVIPEEREAKLHRKLNEPILKEKVAQYGWRFIRFGDLSGFYAQVKNRKVIDLSDMEKLFRFPESRSETQESMENYFKL